MKMENGALKMENGILKMENGVLKMEMEMEKEMKNKKPFIVIMNLFKNVEKMLELNMKP